MCLTAWIVAFVVAYYEKIRRKTGYSNLCQFEIFAIIKAGDYKEKKKKIRYTVETSLQKYTFNIMS